jgi:threonine dehydratase
MTKPIDGTAHLGPVVRTPVTALPSHGWRSLVVKDETRQTSGAFKYRGNGHRVAGLAPGTRVVAASTGNHASGLAVASADHLDLTVYIPRSTPQAKLQRITGAGARAVLVDGNYDDCEAQAWRVATETGAVFVHSFDDTDVIDGHRSLFREVAEQSGRPDVVFVPIGGGGLITAALREWAGQVRIIGVEYDRAPAMRRSLAEGRRVTLDHAVGMPEGLLVRRVGRIAFETCRDHDLEVVTIGDVEMQNAMRVLWHEAGIRVEGAGAAALAAALGRAEPHLRALTIASGGNIDPAVWSRWVEGPTWTATVTPAEDPAATR